VCVDVVPVSCAEGVNMFVVCVDVVPVSCAEGVNMFVVCVDVVPFSCAEGITMLTNMKSHMAYIINLIIEVSDRIEEDKLIVLNAPVSDPSSPLYNNSKSSIYVILQLINNEINEINVMYASKLK